MTSHGAHSCLFFPHLFWSSLAFVIDYLNSALGFAATWFRKASVAGVNAAIERAAEMGVQEAGPTSKDLIIL